MGLISLDGAQGEGGGQILRTAIALSAATGQGFEITRIRAGRPRPGLQPQHLAAVRAVGLACGAKMNGVFDGSPDLRFEPGEIAPGEYRFEIGTAGATSLVLQAIAPVLALSSRGSRVEITGGTHVPSSPSFDYLSRHWADVASRLGLATRFSMARAGFYPPGGGEVAATIEGNWPRPRGLRLEQRGGLVALRGLSGAPRLKGAVAERQRDAVQRTLWEERRLEASVELSEATAASPGSYLILEAVFEHGRAAFGYLGQKGLRAETLGERAARRILKFMEDEEGAVDPHLADQLVLPMAIAGGGGLVTTCEVTRHLETVADVAGRFGVSARVFGRRGGPGGVEVGAR